MKSDLLVTRYSDGCARSLGFLDAHQLFLHYAANDEAASVPLLIDFEGSRVLPTSASPPGQTGTLRDAAGTEALDAEAVDGKIEIRTNKRKLVKRLDRAGKRPLMGFLDDGELFSSSSEVLNRWDLKTGKAKKYKCHDRVTHAVAFGGLIAAQNKEGVICLFDAKRATRLVCIRPAAKGWIAFGDDGAWDASPGFTRGVELSWTDAKSTAFVPGQGFGWLENNTFPLTRVIPPKEGRVNGLIALRTKGFW